MKFLLQKTSRVFMVAVCGLVLVGNGSALAKGKGPKADPPPPTLREFVTFSSGSQISTTKKKAIYGNAGKISYTDVTRVYEVTPTTVVEVNGKRSDAASILSGMVVTISADRKQGSGENPEDVYIARTIIAKDAPKVIFTGAPAKKK